MKALSSPFNWVGSKFLQLKRIVPILDSVEKTRFIDVFGGSGVVTMNIKQAPIMTFNDLDGLIVNFFKVLIDDDKRKRFDEYVAFSPCNKEICLYWREHLNDEDDVRRAVAFFVNATFGAFGMFGRGLITYSVPNDIFNSPANRCTKKLSLLDEVAKKFRRAEIINFDFRKVFEIYDADYNLFYLDPPYISNGNDSYNEGKTFGEKESSELVSLCLKSKNKIVLSCFDNDVFHPLIDANWTRLQWERKISHRRNVVNKTRTETLYVSPNCNYRQADENLFQGASQ